MAVPNLLTGEMVVRNNPLPEDFKSILEISTRSPYCPISFVADFNRGLCSYNCKYCVDGDTKILLSNNKNTPKIKKIKSIIVGDTILGYDENKGLLVTNTVTEIMKRIETEKYFIIHFDEYALKITGEHPVWTKSGWKPVKNLTTDDEMLFYDSPFLRRDAKISKRMKNNNPMKNSETAKKNRDSLQTGGGAKSISEKLTKRWQEDQYYHDLVSNTMKTNNPMWTPIVAIKQGNTRSRKIKNGEIVIKSPFKKNDPWTKMEAYVASLKGNYERPTKLERKLIDIFSEYKIPFKYVGNGVLWINGKNPDFICTTDNFHLIELVGDLYHNHNNDEKSYEEERKKELHPHPILFLYERDIRKPELLIEKTQKFMTNPSISWRKAINISQIEKRLVVYNLEAKGTNNYFANGLLVHNCFQAQSTESLLTSFFDTDKDPMSLTWAKPELVKSQLTEVLAARGVEASSREAIRGTCGSINEVRTLKKAAAQRIPLRVGTRSENFLPPERTHGVSLVALKVIKDFEYPTIINTKSDLILEEPYFATICEMGKNVAIQETISHMDDKFGKLLEPGAPLSSRRWKVLKTFNDVGINAMVRMEPCAHFLNADDTHLQKYMDKASECGCKAFMGDVYHHTVKAEEVQNLFYEIGIDFGRMWEATSEFQILGSLAMEKAMYYAKKKGIRTGTFNYHSIPWNDDPVCCMVGKQFGSWSKFSMVHALRNEFVERPNTDISFTDFDEKYYGLELHPAIRQRIKDVWNLDNINCFNPDFMEGMIPVGRDSEENLIWRFEPRRMGEGYKALISMYGG